MTGPARILPTMQQQLSPSHKQPEQPEQPEQASPEERVDMFCVDERIP